MFNRERKREWVGVCKSERERDRGFLFKPFEFEAKLFPTENLSN